MDMKLLDMSFKQNLLSHVKENCTTAEYFKLKIELNVLIMHKIKMLRMLNRFFF